MVSGEPFSSSAGAYTRSYPRVCDCNTCPCCGGLRRHSPWLVPPTIYPTTPTYPYVTWTSAQQAGQINTTTVN